MTDAKITLPLKVLNEFFCICTVYTFSGEAVKSLCGSSLPLTSLSAHSLLRIAHSSQLPLSSIKELKGGDEGDESEEDEL